MILQRDTFIEEGIFGTLRSDNDEEICKTLEHAYLKNTRYAAKLPSGNYVCERGLHRLPSGMAIETFEVMNVPGYTGILFHIGNFNRDSAGCILIGEAIENKALVRSFSAFSVFMNLLKNAERFSLVVV